jgi:HEAT repeat protein
VGFRGGQFRAFEGLSISGVGAGQTASGFFDIDGDRTLELIAAGEVPGYLEALFPNRRIFRPFDPYDERSTGERDILIYRFVDGEPVLHFPPLAVVPEGIKRGLASGYQSSRLAAAETAGMLRVSEALPRLLSLLSDPEECVEVAAVEALGQIGGPLAAAGIISVLEDKRSGVSMAAAYALANLDDERAVRVILQLRDSENPHFRYAAACVLGRRGGPEAIEALCRYLQDEDGSVRWAAAEALQGLDGRQAAEALAELLDSQRPELRALAARTLAALGDQRATGALIGLVEQTGWEFYVDLLGKLGDETAAPFLLGFSHSTTSGHLYVRQHAVRALCELGDEAALSELADVLVQALSDEDLCVRSSFSAPTAARALGTIGSPAAIPSLLNLLEDDADPCREAAAEALVAIGDPSAIPALRKAAAGPNVEVAEAAKWVLVELGVPEALPMLLEWSRAGDKKATLRLTEMEGEEVEQELPRALRENPPHDDIDDSRWRDRVGWFKKVSRRLGEAAVPALVARLQEVAPWEEKHETPPADEGGSVAMAAAHCLRELGAVEAIPALLKVTASHPNPDAREVARWAVVALRRQGAKWREPLFPEIKQQPLEAYLGPGGPWHVVDCAIANLDGDPEAEFVIAHRPDWDGAPETCVEAIVGLDWRNGQYVSTESLECEVSHTDPLQVRDANNDGVPEVIVEGTEGHFHVLAIFGWHDQGLHLLGWFEGYKAGQLLADLDGDNVLEVLSGRECVVYEDLLERLQAEHLHTRAAEWEVWQWRAGAGEYEQVTGSAAVGLFSLGAQDTQSPVRQPCLGALGWLGDEDTVPILIEALSSEDEDIRGAAIFALARIGGAEAAAALRRVAKSDPDEALRAFAQDIVDRWAQGQDLRVLSYYDTLAG